MTALRLCVERLIPVTRERAPAVRIPAVTSALGITLALKAIFTAIGNGSLTAGEAQKLAAILEQQRKAIETAEIEERIKALEQDSRSNCNYGQHCNE